MTRFYLVRHGNTASNKEDRLRGHADVPLDDSGREQARRTGQALKGAGIGMIYSSTLSRAMETARAIGAATGAAVSAHPGLMDFDFGLWSGRLRSEVKSMWPELYAVYEQKPAEFVSPGGEPLVEFAARVRAGLEDILSTRPQGPVGLVSHNVTCRILLLGLLGLGPERFWNVSVDTCSISVFSSGRGGWVIEALNRTDHLT